MKKFLCYDTNDAASGKIGVNNNGVLSPNATVPSTNGSIYQQLVTDGSGNVKWEDRLAYDGNRVAVEVQYDDDPPSSIFYVKVTDKIPEWMLVEGTQVKVWASNAPDAPITSNVSFNSELGLFNDNMGFFLAVERETTCPILENNIFSGIHFPEKGVYFEKGELAAVVGIAPASSGTPEITWDGSLETIKKLDEKFLPECPVFTVKTKGANKYLHDAKGERMTLEQAKTIGLNFVIQSEHGNGSLIKPISVVYDSVNARFYAVKLEDLFGDGISIKFNNYYAGEDVENVE